MQQYGFTSVLVLAKIGYDLREEFADTFHEPVEDVFGPFLEALEDAKAVLSLGSDEYQWLSNDHPFQYATQRKQVA